MLDKTAEGTRTSSTGNFRFVGFEPQLSQLLWDAIRISKAMKKKSAGLDEFVAAFCLKDDIVQSFEAKKGVLPVNFLKRLPGGPELDK